MSRIIIPSRSRRSSSTIQSTPLIVLRRHPAAMFSYLTLRMRCRYRKGILLTPALARVSKHMTQAIIFDVDGTLIDSVDLHARSWEDTFRHFGHQLPFEAIRNEIGKGADKLMATFLDEKEIQRRGKEITAFRLDLFKRRYLPEVKAFPCVRELFERADERGRKIALATSAHGDELEAYLKLMNVGDLLEAQTSSDDAEESKPAPDIFCAALDRLGVPGREAVVVGDSRYDAQAAVKAEAAPVGVLCGGFAESDLREHGCVEVYRDPEDLLKRFEDSVLAR